MVVWTKVLNIQQSIFQAGIFYVFAISEKCSHIFLRLAVISFLIILEYLYLL